MDVTQGRTASPILVVDDSSTIRRSAEIFLAQSGYSVVFAEDGFEGIAKIMEHAPALILCDVLMPRLDGYQICSLVRHNPRF